MSLLAVGSIAFDNVKTPAGEVKDVLGGSGVYFSCAASFFGPVRLVGVVGEDFPDEHLEFLVSRGVDTAGITRCKGRTFRWCGSYEGAMNEATTLEVDLNVFGDFEPEIPPSYRDSLFLFLANGAPRTQLCVLDQLPQARFTVADTMNLWIENEREDLRKVIERVDLLFINEGEVRMLTGKSSLVEAGREAVAMGAKGVVVKKGEHGALLVMKEECFALPAFPVDRLVDPTGAGDSFAGGFMGYVSSAGDLEPETIKRGLAHATVAASFNVENFSLRRFSEIDRSDIDKRYQRYAAMLRLD